MFLDIDFLKQIHFGNPMERWLMAVIVIVMALFVNHIFRIIVDTVLKKWVKKTKHNIDDIFLDSIRLPIQFGIMILAFAIVIAQLEIPQKIEETLEKGLYILFVIDITWMVARIAVGLTYEILTKKNQLDTHIIILLQKIINVLVWIIGGVTGLQGVGIPVATLLGSLGLGGAAFALASQDTIKNIFGGFTILSDKTFRLGDVIRVGDVEGYVEDIGIRSTRVRTYGGRITILPNYQLTNQNIENITSEPTRRVEMLLGLVYSTTPAQMNKAINILKELPNTMEHLEEDKTMVTFHSFDDFSLTIKYYVYVKKSGHVLNTPSELRMKILEEFNNAGLEFAFPTQTLHIEK